MKRTAFRRKVAGKKSVAATGVKTRHEQSRPPMFDKRTHGLVPVRSDRNCPG